MPLRSANLPLGRVSQPRLLSTGPNSLSLSVGRLPATRKFSLDYWLPITIQLPIFQEIRILPIEQTRRKTGTLLITRESELFSIRRILL